MNAILLHHLPPLCPPPFSPLTYPSKALTPAMIVVGNMKVKYAAKMTSLCEHFYNIKEFDTKWGRKINKPQSSQEYLIPF